MSQILIVEDDPVQAVRFAAMLRRCGHETASAADGDEALFALDQADCEAVLLDLHLPGLSGPELIGQMLERHPAVPIIAMTAQGSEETAVEALQAGAATYLPKRNLPHELPELLDKVLAMARDFRGQERLQASLTHIESHFTLENDESLVMPLVSYLLENVSRMQLCDARGRVRLGIAVREAILNAMERGNLGAPAELRDRDPGEYRQLLERRRNERPYSQRRVRVMAKVSHDEAAFVIRDEGAGFEPRRRQAVSGRGLLLIRNFMDEVFHNVTGSQITMVKRRSVPVQAGPVGLSLAM